MSARSVILVFLTNFQIRYAEVTRGISLIIQVSSTGAMWWARCNTHKYDATNVSGSQFPLVKTLKPLVKRIRRHMNKHTYELYTTKKVSVGETPFGDGTRARRTGP